MMLRSSLRALTARCPPKTYVSVPPLHEALRPAPSSPVRHISTSPCCTSVAVKGIMEQAQPLMGPGSEELRGMSCKGACSIETPKVKEEELPRLLASVPDWKLNAERTAITRAFTARNFMAAIDFFNKVAALAESEGHHPDLHLRNYRDVEITLSTHAVGGLTLPDFIMASKLDAIPVDYSQKWLKQHLAAKEAAAKSP